MTDLQRICVFCGSSGGARPQYGEAARDLAGALVAEDIGLVYGGGSIGLMGEVANAVLAEGGEVIGVIPRQLAGWEVPLAGLSDLRIVGSMHERKAVMFDLSDGFIALPGGLGTLEELFEILTWLQLGLHLKPAGLINVAGYYSGLRTFLDHAVTEGFVREEHRELLLVDEQPALLLSRMRAFRPPAIERRIDETSR